VGFPAQPSKTNFTSGAVSPLLKGREDVSKYFSGVEILENGVPLIQGGLTRRSGTVFTAETKDSGKVRLIEFIFNEEQSYVLEIGDSYIRFFTQNGQVTQAATTITNTVQSNPVTVTAAGHGFAGGERVVITGVTGMTELNNVEYEVTNVAGNDFDLLGIDGTVMTTYISGGEVAEIFEIAAPWTGTEIFEMQYAQSGDVMYLVHPSHEPRKLVRTSALNWTLSIPAFTSILFTGANDRPSCVSFIDQRLALASTNNEPRSVWLSVAGSIEDFTLGTAAADAIKQTIAGVRIDRIRWLSPTSKTLGMGTVGSEYSLGSNDRNDAITPTNFRANPHTFYGSANIQPVQMEVSTLYIQRGGRRLFDFTYSYERDGFASSELTILNDQILFNEATDLAYQQEPNNNVLVTTDTGHIGVLTYRRDQEVVGWGKHILGGTSVIAESVTVIPDVNEDQIWTSVKRKINGQTKRYIEYFKQRFIETSTVRKEDAVMMDSSLTLDTGAITVTGATNANPIVITAVGHNLSNGTFITPRFLEGMTEVNDRSYKIANVTANTLELTDEDDNPIDGTNYGVYTEGGNIRYETTSISGLNHLIGETVEVMVDGRAHTQKTVDSGGRFTLDFRGSIVHIGLPTTMKVKFLPLVLGNPQGSAQGKQVILERIKLRLYQTLGGKLSIEDGEKSSVIFNKDFTTMDQSPPLKTGITSFTYPFNGVIDEEASITYENSTPFPATILAILPEYKVNP